MYPLGVGGELHSVLGEQVLTDDALTDWQVSLIECLAPETARSVYTSLVVAGMVSNETYVVTDQEIACVSEWVAGADLHRIIRGMAEDDQVFFGELLSGVLPCLADFFMSEFLSGMGIDPGSLTDDELICLNEWAVGYDWSNVMTAMVEEDLGIKGELFLGLISCAPEPFLALFFEDTGLDPDQLTDEEMECLEDWLTDFDWDSVLAAISAAALAEDYESYSILAEAFGLLACVPNLFLADGIGSFGPNDRVDTIEDATPVAIGASAHGIINHSGDVAMFALPPTAGEHYQIDVALGTLGDFVLDVYGS